VGLVIEAGHVQGARIELFEELRVAQHLCIMCAMRILRCLTENGLTVHVTEGERGSYHLLSGNPYDGFKPTQSHVPVARWLAPIVPAMIWCIGLNYRRHAEETGAKIPEQPVVFAKGPNTVQHPGGAIEIPRHLASEQVDYECELAIVIGKACKNVSPDDALDYVLGYTCANDVSARDWQIKRGGSQWSRGKTFDTFAPLGPAIVTPEDIPDPNALRIQTRLNGEVVQDSNTSDMIFSVREIIAFLSGSTTLVPGTVILTGTPEGVGMARTPPRWLVPGDEVTIEIEKIGALTNPVVLEPA
jgi:2-keto-4-pentenoate hydratase/2-oxohepta-3-ene-1,7-dioic acid hydratase in catechol pathway